jgi:branched-chain amino acid transport system ATP-binding protein
VEAVNGSNLGTTEPKPGAGSIPLLSFRNVSIWYDQIPTLIDVSFQLYPNEIFALLGANGAGKTTVLRSISGLLHFHGGWISTGNIYFDGRALRSTAAARVRAGIAQVLEGRRIFQDMSVQDNLIAGGFTTSGARRRNMLEKTYGLFPLLYQRRSATAGLLSGGQQQMLAIGRALMAQPRLLLLDEPSLGLAPKTIDLIVAAIVAINRAGTGIILVEQNASIALAIASHALVLETGRAALQGSAVELRNNPRVRDLYLGASNDAE